ncbi:hypothetical protein UFOVP1382_72 [uncultured Caudovirales phage]|uniref:Uncharacterized protein n=1 Tax=uncultured Caudovirales phage TaxID=2100421 RepID=A0A6J5S538_9CAUD|nr:hypothetical protein UFOVP1382_72 [uncultured Caudovirales phage]
MHVNYRRGESRVFVFRREHGALTHDTYTKGKRNSWKPYKVAKNRALRRASRLAVRLGRDLPRKRMRDISWLF